MSTVLSFIQTYFVSFMWLLFVVGAAGTVLYFYFGKKNKKIWYSLASSLCIGSLFIVVGTGGIDSPYFLTIYLATILCSLRSTYWFSVAFCAISFSSIYLQSGAGLAVFSGIASLTKILLLPFFTIISYFINASLNKPLDDIYKKQDERVEQAYAIARSHIAEKEESEIQLYDRQRKLYSLLDFFRKLSNERSTKVIEESVVYFAREELSSSISFIAFKEDDRWQTPRFLGINEIVAQSISKKIEAGIFD
ncbi:hypothetical protein IJT10_06525, partial [bacterium]|nr:hypothetical protein [bacterium]